MAYLKSEFYFFKSKGSTLIDGEIKLFRCVIGVSGSRSKDAFVVGAHFSNT